jgi:hypothetical protein
MRIVSLLTFMLATCGALADPAPPETFYVRYAIKLNYLPPLIGEKSCNKGWPCELVSLDRLTITLTAPYERSGSNGVLTIDCELRRCALRDGERRVQFRKRGRFIGFTVTDREYDISKSAVIRYPGETIGEILLAY